MEEYKKVSAIQLYDAGRTLYAKDNDEGDIFGDFCRGKHFTIDGRVVKQICEVLNIHFNSTIDLGGKRGYDDIEYTDFEVARENLNIKYDMWSPPDAIYAIETPSLLKIKIEWNGNDGPAKYDYITYKGNYAILWD